MINGLIAVAVNVGFDIILVRFMQHKGLALATSISSLVSAITLYISLKKFIQISRSKTISSHL